MSREDDGAAQRSPGAGSAGASRPVRGIGFLREVRGELRRVHWPSRSEVASYSLVVLVAVSLLTLLVFGFDQVFGSLVLWVFG